MTQAFICDAIRTPFGRYGGALSSVRTDDLGAIPLRALMARNPNVDWAAITDVLFGCANQAGEDNRNVAHMSSLLAGLPLEVPGATINRLCGSGLDAVGTAARAIKAGEAGLMIAGGVERQPHEARHGMFLLFSVRTLKSIFCKRISQAGGLEQTLKLKGKTALSLLIFYMLQEGN